MTDGGAKTTTTPKQQPKAAHVYQAIAAITDAFSKSGISKDRENRQQGFVFRGIDDVLNALAPLLAANHLVILPKVLKRELTERSTQKGGVLFNVVVEVEYRFVSAMDGSEATVGPFPGEAMDAGDKATNKAVSAAYKYMAFQTFCIPTEGDNDADGQSHEEIAPRRQAPQPKPKTDEIRPHAAGFVDRAKQEIDTGKEENNVRGAYETIKLRGGWKSLTDYERSVITKHYEAALGE